MSKATFIGTVVAGTSQQEAISSYLETINGSHDNSKVVCRVSQSSDQVFLTSLSNIAKPLSPLSGSQSCVTVMSNRESIAKKLQLMNDGEMVATSKFELRSSSCANCNSHLVSDNPELLSNCIVCGSEQDDEDEGEDNVDVNIMPDSDSEMDDADSESSSEDDDSDVLVDAMNEQGFNADTDSLQEILTNSSELSDTATELKEKIVELLGESVFEQAQTDGNLEDVLIDAILESEADAEDEDEGISESDDSDEFEEDETEEDDDSSEEDDSESCDDYDSESESNDEEMDVDSAEDDEDDEEIDEAVLASILSSSDDEDDSEDDDSEDDGELDSFSGAADSNVPRKLRSLEKKLAWEHGSSVGKIRSKFSKSSKFALTLEEDEDEEASVSFENDIAKQVARKLQCTMSRGEKQRGASSFLFSWNGDNYRLTDASTGSIIECVEEGDSESSDSNEPAVVQDQNRGTIGANDIDIEDMLDVDLLEDNIGASASVASNNVQLVYAPSDNIGETKWFAIVNDAPVAYASMHSVGQEKSAIFTTDAFRKGTEMLMTQMGVTEGLMGMGFKSLSMKLPVKNIVASHVATATASVSEEAKQRVTGIADDVRAALATAAVGINKGFFSNMSNPIKVQLYDVLTAAGLKNAETLIDSAFDVSADEYHRTLLAKAFDLMNKPVDARNEISQAVMTASYQRSGRSEGSSLSSTVGNRLSHIGTQANDAGAGAMTASANASPSRQNSAALANRINAVVGGLF